MSGGDDDDKVTAGPVDPSREIGELFDDLEALLKNGDVIAALTARDINASLALLAAQALRAYLANRKEDAAEDFATVAEEIRARLGFAAAGSPGNGGGR
jgi:hypothetical protein